MNPESLLRTYQRSANVLLLNLDGLTSADALWTPAPNVNSINWLLGHIISARTNVLRAVGQEPVWDDETRARYKGGSEPITGEGEGVLDLPRLMTDFTESQRRLEAGLATVTSDTLTGAAMFPQFATLTDQLLYMHAHEINHVGHVMVVRELLGKASHWA